MAEDEVEEEAGERRRNTSDLAIQNTPNAERYVLEADAMRRRQLRSALLHGTGRNWRENRRAWPGVVAGIVIVAVIIAALAVIDAFEVTQENERKQEQEQKDQSSQEATPSGTASAPGKDQTQSGRTGPAPTTGTTDSAASPDG